jgi:arylsulfatase A-like enzyme
MTWPDVALVAPARAAVRRLAGWAVLGAAALAAAALAAGCRRDEPVGFALRPLVEAGRYTTGAALATGGGAPAGLHFTAPPVAADLEIDHELRPVVLTPAAPWTWTGRVPPRAELHAGLQLMPVAWQRVRRLQVVVSLRSGREREVLQVARSAERVELRWLDLEADLGRWAGRRVTIELVPTLGGLPARLRRTNLVAWGPVTLAAAGDGGGGHGRAAERRPSAAAARGADPPPNIILILVDTLRRDRLTPYGYRLDTSPEIARRLAAAGTVVEDAYSQAPWTLPSVVSMMTGRYPGELLGSDLSAYGIPAGVAPIAERLGLAGYETAGFLANPTMHVGAGFERGFRTFYAPPADVEWLRRHADDLNRHALPWIAAYQHQDRPFFLYLHYIDPHDPYDNPEIVGNRSRFEDEYRGPVAGDWVNGVYTGKLVLPDPPRDLAHLSALYDGEVHYVDRAIGQLLGSLSPQVLARTLVVLTADHGEELFDHGGWKHGQALYDEQIHVPLIWRWDGHVPAGRRLAGTVRLLDLAPTLADAAGTPPDPGWEGLDLLPALTGKARLAERPAFAEGLSGGPLRAAAVLGRLKLMVFNRQEPFAPANELQAHLWQQDLARMSRIELYDLARDPGERHNLAASPAGTAGPAGSAGAGVTASTAGVAASSGPAGRAASRAAAASDPAGAPGSGSLWAAAARLPLLATVLDRRLDRSLAGLRLLAAGIPAGSRMRLDVVLASPPRRVLPYLLSAADRVSRDGTHLTLDLVGSDQLARGVIVEGDFEDTATAAGTQGARGAAGAPGAAVISAAARGTAAIPGATGISGDAGSPGSARAPRAAEAAGGPGGAAGGAGGGGGMGGAGGGVAVARDGLVQSLSATVDGRPLPAARVRAGAGAAYGGGPLSLAALRSRQWPGALPDDGGPAVAIWMHDASGGPARRVAHDAETERRLRALGYIQ